MYDQSMMSSEKYTNASPYRDLPNFGASVDPLTALTSSGRLSSLSLPSTPLTPPESRDIERHQIANHEPDSCIRETETDENLGLSSEPHPPQHYPLHSKERSAAPTVTSRGNAHVRPCCEVRGLVGCEIGGAGACGGRFGHIPASWKMKFGKLWGGCAAWCVLSVRDLEVET